MALSSVSELGIVELNEDKLVEVEGGSPIGKVVEFAVSYTVSKCIDVAIEDQYDGPERNGEPDSIDPNPECSSL